MAKLLKNRSFPLQFERFFTREDADAFDLIHFRESETESDPACPLECPDNWNVDAASTLAEQGSCKSIPAYTRSVEENTVPSWLWRRVAENRLRTSENSVRQIFHRTAGTAAYTGWKKDVFANESQTRIFFDEIRYALAQRFIAFEPEYLAAPGLNWAYGIDKKPQAGTGMKKKSSLPVRNASIDALVGGDVGARQKWQKILSGGNKANFLELSFADIANDWNTQNHVSTRAAVDLMALRREDGGIDIDRLSHAVKLLVVLLELQDDRAGGCIAINLHNLAPLLMSRALAYDSDAGRMTAAAIAAIVTAEAYVASAQLAALLGPSLDFAANREGIQRALRNHRRAAYGERNDYEKMSVLPVPLALDRGADLALVAAARRKWDDALEMVQQHGLRFTQPTDFTPVPTLAFFTESSSQGIDPLPALTVTRASADEAFRREIHPAVAEALKKLGYRTEARKAILRHIVGAGTLEHAPAIDHAALRNRGFTGEALEKIENYLGNVTDIRFAFTPWIIGEDFCRTALNLVQSQIDDPRFELLGHLGFSGEDIEAVNVYCYGYGTMRGAPGLTPAHAAIFATATTVTAEARIRMAGAVQSFISGDAGLQIPLPAGSTIAENENLLLSAWRMGVKSISLEIDGAASTAVEAPASEDRESRRPATPITPASRFTAPLRSTLRGRSKASGELVGIRQSQGGKTSSGKKRPDGER
ncbi:MAG: hypothetical protein AB7H77_06375 [Bdellovibrionales bacterium]